MKIIFLFIPVLWCGLGFSQKLELSSCSYNCTKDGVLISVDMYFIEKFGTDTTLMLYFYKDDLKFYKGTGLIRDSRMMRPEFQLSFDSCGIVDLSKFYMTVCRINKLYKQKVKLKAGDGLFYKTNIDVSAISKRLCNKKLKEIILTNYGLNGTVILIPDFPMQ